MEWYEVDLRSRKDGDSIECIYSGDNHDEAYSVVEKWYKDNMPDWNSDHLYEELIDGTDGVFAYCYHLDENEKRFGVGKMRREKTKKEYIVSVRLFYDCYIHIKAYNEEEAKKIANDTWIEEFYIEEGSGEREVIDVRDANE